jgi:large subunit ribosomal protein L10
VVYPQFFINYIINIMPKIRAKKEEEVNHLVEQFKKSKSVVFTAFEGLTVAESEQLRRKLEAEKVTLQVSKKTLLKKALDQAEVGKDLNFEGLKGNVATAFGNDEVAPAKILAEFAKNHDKLKLNFGLLEGNFIGLDKVKELATLPSRIELIAKAVGSIKAPLSGMVNVLAGNLRGLVNVLNSLKDKKQA